MDDFGMTVLFIDRKGREIEIELLDEWPPKLEARHDGKKIGHLDFDEYRDMAVLESADVKQEYQKAGIGTRMFKELVEVNEDVYVPNRLWSSATGHDYYLSIEGAALVNACIRDGILTNANEAPY
ncbi:GNAT family N-acetyltransferase [Shewanella chilikensis]|uniref:GNAT family N-acetyltransferase n=1 Tax=Shewanella chilikensis TaxID=558541 RepID=UPI00399AA8D5